MWIKIVKDSKRFSKLPKTVIKVSIINSLDSGTILFKYDGKKHLVYSWEYVEVLDNEINRLLYF